MSPSPLPSLLSRYATICDDLAHHYRELGMVLDQEYRDKNMGYRAARANGDSHSAAETAGKIASETASTEAIRLRMEIEALVVEKTSLETQIRYAHDPASD